MNATEKPFDPADPIRCDELYDHVLKITKLVRASEILADQAPVLHTDGAPPIHYLLELALDELDKLEHRVSP